MEVPSLARGEDKQPIAAPKPLCMTLRTSDVQGNGPKASISSALHHLAWLQCQNYCLLAFIFSSHRMTPELHVIPTSLPLSLELTGSLARWLRYPSRISHSSKILSNRGQSKSNLMYSMSISSNVMHNICKRLLITSASCWRAR